MTKVRTTLGGRRRQRSTSRTGKGIINLKNVPKSVKIERDNINIRLIQEVLTQS